MKNFVVNYICLVNKIRRNKNLKEFVILFLAVLAGIYINLFTNNDSFKGFFELKLTALTDTWLMSAFGLIALIAIIKSAISLLILALLFFIMGFFLFVLYELYIKLLNLIKKFKTKWLVVVIFVFTALLEFIGLLISWKMSNGLDKNFMLECFFGILSIATVKVLVDLF